MVKIYLLIILCTTIACRQSDNQKNSVLEKSNKWFFWSVDWHPTKNQVVVGGSNDSYLKVLSTKNYEELQSWPYEGTITQTKWHPTKNKIAIAVQDNKSKLAILNIDKNSKEELIGITSDGARAIGWNSSGNILAVGDNEGYLSFFDENANLLRSVDTGQKGLLSLDWHPSQDVIVTVGERIAIYNFETDSLEQIEDRNEEVLMLSVSWNPNGKIFVTGDYGDYIERYPPLLQYWTYDGNKIISIAKSKAEYRNVKWSHNGEFLATASEKLRIWSNKGDLIDEKKTENLLWGIDWNENDDRLVTTDEGGNIIFWTNNLIIEKEISY